MRGGCITSNFSPKQLEIAKTIVSFASLFRASYEPEKPRDAISALLKFVNSYAYERQGSARAYRTIGTRVINEIFDGNIVNITQRDADLAWRLYKKIAREDYGSLKGLNDTRNPLKSNGGVLNRLAEKGKKNIYTYVKELLLRDGVKQAYSFIYSIRGVGPKISSLYLRDVAYLELDSAKHFHYLLQPIDTWLNQAIELILKHTAEKVPKKPSDQQKLIVDLCREAKCSPIDFNQGAWVAGSVIAQDYGTFKDVIEGKAKAKSVIQKRIGEREKLIHAMKEWLKDNA